MFEAAAARDGKRCRNGAGEETRVRPIKPHFLFDFGSPNAYFCHLVLPEIERRTGVRFEYAPVLLGGISTLTNNKSPIDAHCGACADWRKCQARLASPNAPEACRAFCPNAEVFDQLRRSEAEASGS